MKFKNYARFKRKKIKQKQERDYIDFDILFNLSFSKTLSEHKERLRQEIAFCDLIKTNYAKERKGFLRKELQELEVYSVNEF